MDQNCTRFKGLSAEQVERRKIEIKRMEMMDIMRAY